VPVLSTYDAYTVLVMLKSGLLMTNQNKTICYCYCYNHYQKQTCEKPCEIVEIFTWYSHVFHTYFIWNSTCMRNFATWKARENNVKNVILFTQCFTCPIRQIHTPVAEANMWNTVWNGGYFHTIFRRHTFFTW